MGEFEKRVGEHGEETAAKFLELIGWTPRAENFDIDCVDDSHQNKKHGIDAYFNYKSPLMDEVLDHVVISIKYSISGYPSSPSGKFKEHYLDLASKISCFDRSSDKRQASKNIHGVKRSRTYGLLIWFHGNDNETDGVIAELENIRFKEEISIHSRPIYVVDKRQMRFIEESIKYVQDKYSDYKSSFTYQHTGSNISAVDRATDGTFLPIQLLVSGILVFRLENVHAKEVKACICTSDVFSEETFEKLVGLAQYMTSNFASETIIAFRNFRPEVDKKTAAGVLMSFSNRDFATRISVESFKIYIV